MLVLCLIIVLAHATLELNPLVGLMIGREFRHRLPFLTHRAMCRLQQCYVAILRALPC